jgi:surface protein
MFAYCNSLTSLDLSSFDTSNVTNMTYMFYYNHKLQRIDGYIDWGKISSYPSSFISSNSPYPLRYMTIKNLGKTGTTFNFNNTNLQNWGDESDTTTYPLSVGARQSLVDTFVNYTYDRVSNGMGSCTIQLYSKIKARLTNDEIAAITAKGFTVT